jgi:[acyl-carrier-protein] S-malonyltransferase
MGRALSLSGVRVGWMFPGQGSQFPGMGASVAREWPAAAEVYAQAERLTRLPVTTWCHHGWEASSRRTKVTQLSVFVTSHSLLAATRARLREMDLPTDPVVAAGNSLGEINALVAADALAFAEALLFVQARGDAFEEQSTRDPGGMVAITGLGRGEVDEICREYGAEVANVNSDYQHVVAVDRELVSPVCAAATRRGAKRVKLLPIAIASHSRWGHSVSEKMRPAIDALDLVRPRFPIVLNGTGEASDDVAEIRAELWRNVSTTVLWSASVQTMVAMGAEALLEIGPGETLARLAPHIVDCPAASVGAFTPLRSVIRA